eukprot:tig00001001_g6207.t1
MLALRTEGLSAAELDLYFYWRQPQRQYFSLVGDRTRIPTIDDGFFYVARRGGAWPRKEDSPFLREQLQAATAAAAVASPSADIVTAVNAAAAAAAQAVLAASSMQPIANSEQRKTERQEVDADRELEVDLDSTAAAYEEPGQLQPTVAADIELQPGDSLAAAVAQAAPGQTIRLAPGQYKVEETVVLDKDVHIVGPRELEAVLEASGEQRTVLMCKGPAAPSIRGITIQHAGISRYGSDRALWITDGSRAVVKGCVLSVAPAGLCGIHISGETTAPTLRGNAVHSCGRIGIFFGDSAAGVAEGNFVYGNKLKGAGILIRDGADPVVRGNSVYDGNGAGIMVRGGAKGTIDGNDVHGNKGTGIVIEDSKGTVVRGNTVHGNGDVGILVFKKPEGPEGQSTVEGNEVYGNADAGIVISDGGDAIVKENRCAFASYNSLSIRILFYPYLLV